jgi:heat shock protein HtpX
VSTKTRFPADRGLTARMMTTVFLIGLLYALLVTALALSHLRIEWVILIPVVLVVAQYFYSDRIALWAMHAKVVTPEQAPQLHAVVDRLCNLANMEKPRVGIARMDMPNAFATGRNQSHAVVCVTTGILRRLDEPELEAVLAHELSHVAHRDVAVMTIASFLGIISGLLMRVLFYGALFGGGGRRVGSRNNQGGSAQLVLFELAAFAVSAAFYFVSFLLIRALSRYRELAADRSGAILIGQPRLLMNALIKVTGEIGRVPSQDLRTAQNFNAFFFAPALTRGGGASMANLFSTHPSLEVRLEQLAKLEAKMGSAR